MRIQRHGDTEESAAPIRSYKTNMRWVGAATGTDYNLTDGPGVSGTSFNFCRILDIRSSFKTEVSCRKFSEGNIFSVLKFVLTYQSTYPLVIITGEKIGTCNVHVALFTSFERKL